MGGYEISPCPADALTFHPSFTALASCASVKPAAHACGGAAMGAAGAGAAAAAALSLAGAGTAQLALLAACATFSLSSARTP